VPGRTAGAGTLHVRRHSVVTRRSVIGRRAVPVRRCEPGACRTGAGVVVHRVTAVSRRIRGLSRRAGRLSRSSAAGAR